MKPYRIVLLISFIASLCVCTQCSKSEDPVTPISNVNPQVEAQKHAAIDSSAEVKNVIETKNEASVEPAEKTTDIIAFKDVKRSNTLPKRIQELIAPLKMKKGYFLFPKIDQSPHYLYIGMGSKRSGGFNINVNDVTRKDDSYIVSVEEKQPGRNAMVTMAITFPYALIELPTESRSDANPLSIIVKNSKGMEYPQIME